MASIEELKQNLRKAELNVYEWLLQYMKLRKEKGCLYYLEEPLEGNVEGEKILGVDPEREAIVVHSEEKGTEGIALSDFEQSNGAWDMAELAENLPKQI